MASERNPATENSQCNLGHVDLVGAGPGDSGLLTLRGKECLERADFVLYDQLVTEQILKLTKAGAELVCVRELADTHPERLPIIHARLIEEARKGKRVVRLKGGDPLIFGRGGEEAEALRQAGIPVEIVPGVTAALAAGACLEIPLTHRSYASAVALVTGHEDPEKPSSRIDWQALARFPGTLCIYMGLSRIRTIADELIRNGMTADTPAVAVALTSTGEQRSIFAPLSGLGDAIRGAELTSPTVILIGPVVQLGREASWFNSRPLFGMRVLITRPRAQAQPMLRQLELLGAVPHSLPVIDIQPPEDWAQVDDAIGRVASGGIDWLVFTSVNGVETLLQRLLQSGRDLRALASTSLATIGPSTAARLREYHLMPDVYPVEGSRSETLAGLLRERVVGQRVLLAQAAEAREHLHAELQAVAHVEKVVVYRQVEAVDSRSPELERLRRGEIDVVTLTSPAIAKTFLSAIDDAIRERIRAGGIRLVTNGARISTTVRERGFEVAAESREPNSDSLVETLIQLWKKV